MTEGPRVRTLRRVKYVRNVCMMPGIIHSPRNVETRETDAEDLNHAGVNSKLCPSVSIRNRLFCGRTGTYSGDDFDAELAAQTEVHTSAESKLSNRRRHDSS